MKKHYILLFLTLFFLTITIKISAQKTHAPDKLPFTKFTDKDGLSNSHINAIGQDEKGFIWIATNDGLNRFDGLKFETFYNIPSDSVSVNNNTVFTIFVDKDKQIWFGTFSGLCRYDYTSGSFINVELPLQPQTHQKFPIRAILQTPDGDIWLALSGGGLARMNLEKKTVKYYRHNNANENSLCSDGLLSMALDKEGNIWIGSEDNGISIFDTKEQTFTNINKASGKIPGNVINSLLCTNDGKIIIGIYGAGLTIYDSKEKKFKIYTECCDVYSTVEGIHNNLWIGTQNNGLFYFDIESETFWNFSKKYSNAEELISDNIHAVFSDKDNNLWLGIFQGGINLLKPKSMFSGIGHRNEINSNSPLQKPVLGLCGDNQDNIYIATDGDGILIWNTQDNSFKHIKVGENGLNTNVIRCVYKDHNNKIWVGTYLEGLLEFDSKTQQFKAYKHIQGDETSLSHNDVTAITEDRLGNLWVATNGGGLNLMDKKNGIFKTFAKDGKNPDNSLINNHIVSLYIDRHGYLWIGTYWGLSRIDPVRKDFKNFGFDGDYNSYNCMIEDSKQRFWAGTSSGLKLIDTETGNYRIFTWQDGLANNTINAIEEDDNGNLWISTNKGISKFRFDNGTISNYSTDDGLFSNEFIHGASYKSPKGEIFFGGIDGITKFLPKNIKNHDFVPEVVLTDFMVFNHSIKPNEENNILEKSITNSTELSLNQADNSFTIVYRALDYAMPQKVVYAVRMRGFNDNWTTYDYQKNYSDYTNLDAGVYYFEVKASVDGENFSKPTILKITIIAPIWKRYWMIILYCLVVCGIIAIVLKKYRQYENEKHEIKIRYLKQQNDIELNKTRLRLFTDISHEFRTPLTLIISPLEEMLEDKSNNEKTLGRLSVIYRNAQRLLRMVNEIMDLRKLDNDKVIFRPSKGDLIAFLREIYQNFQQYAENKLNKFSFESDLDNFEAYFDKEQIDKIMYNLLSNAFKFTPKGGTISISVKKADDKNLDNIVIIVEDNGQGIAEENLDKIFDRFYQGSTSKMQQGTGIGLYLTKKFVEMHHGIISVSSKENQGTAFTIMLTKGLEFQNAVEDSQYEHIKFMPQSAETIKTSNDENAEQETIQNKSLVLIVEDNEEIRNYTTELLKNKYEIKTASNGKEGLDKAREIMPELIITDVMMPEMDGTQLTKILKSDIETCHIPIIMLSAKNSEQQKIEGLETGADSYIPKPFNPKHLLVRAEKLLELRAKLKEKFSAEIKFDAEDTAVTSPDRDLLKKVTQIIKSRISDPQLSVENLSEQVGLSRGHLQRKLKNLTGQNPNEFIRIIRLKHAAEILAEKDVTISEVADLVGFSSQSYFSTAFTKQFNISPSQFVENSKKNVSKS